MLRLEKVYEAIRVRERSDQTLRTILLARFGLAVLGLIGLEIVLVVWLYVLPPQSPYFSRLSGSLAPSILLTHPTGPVCLLLVMVAVAIMTVCRDLARLTRNKSEEAQRKAVEVRRSLSQGYVLAAIAATMILLTLTNWRLA